MDKFDAGVLKNAFEAAMLYTRKVRKVDEGVSYASINWNYMPPAGAGIIHPDLQVIVGANPTLFYERLLTESLKYHREEERNY